MKLLIILLATFSLSAWARMDRLVCVGSLHQVEGTLNSVTGELKSVEFMSLHPRMSILAESLKPKKTSPFLIYTLPDLGDGMSKLKLSRQAMLGDQGSSFSSELAFIDAQGQKIWYQDLDCSFSSETL